MRIRTLLAALALVLAATTQASAASAVAAAGWTIDLTRHAPDHAFSSPTQVTNAGDGTNRLFVVERRGTVRIVQNGAVRAGHFLDIRSLVSTGGERGLLSIAFHPRFETNGRLFAFYTRTDGDVVVARFTANAARTRVDAATKRSLLLIEHSAKTNHNGGGMAFGPDGYLYVGVGDGGGAGDPERDAQSITRNLLGKILRIDVDRSGAGPFDRYAIPGSNPFAGATRGLDEIWAYGVRNPWRIAFDRATGSLFIADVGQARREEVDRQAAGAAGGRNYGWPVMEGSLCHDPSPCSLAGDTLPVAQYGHDDGDCSITGGFVYRGTREQPLIGQYVFADFCSGRIRSMPAGGSTPDVVVRRDTALRITSFGESEAGGLYAVTIDGKLYRLSAS